MSLRIELELRAEIERLKTHNKVLCDNQHDHVRLCTRIHEQGTEIERLTAALEWYAKSFNYNTTYTQESAVQQDKGATARRALGQEDRG